MISVTFNIRVGTLYANRVRVLSSVKKEEKAEEEKEKLNIINGGNLFAFALGLAHPAQSQSCMYISTDPVAFFIVICL